MFRVVGTISIIRPLEIFNGGQFGRPSRPVHAESKLEPSRIVPLSRMHYAAGNPLSNGLKVASPSFGFLQRDFAISDCRRRRERRYAKTRIFRLLPVFKKVIVWVYGLFFAKFMIQLFPAKWPKQVSWRSFSKFSSVIILIKFFIIKLCESEILFELNAK